MVAPLPNESETRLSLRSRLSEIAKLPAWIENLASRYAIPPGLRSPMNLCLEEVLSNIVRHGYGGQPDCTVIVQFTAPCQDRFVFVVDDEAPRFNPLAAPELPPVGTHESAQAGGQGIRFLRAFSETLEYEPTSTGNRLRIGFSTAARVRTD